MRSKYSTGGDRKTTNLSFDFTAYGKPRYGVLPQTTLNRDRKPFISNISPNVDSASPRKRLFSAKRDRQQQQPPQQQQKTNNSLNSSKQINTSFNSKRPSQPRNNLTIKTGASIEALKEMLNKQPIYSATNKQSANLKYLLQLNTEKNRVFSIEKNNSQQFHLEIRTSDSSEAIDKKTQIKRSTGPVSGNRTNKSTSKERTQIQKTSSIMMEKQCSPKFNVQLEWSKVKLPLAPHEVLNRFGNALTEFEKNEIMGYKKIYCIGINAKKAELSQSEFNDGFDDAKGEYMTLKHDHVGYRYELLESVGKGSFGQAFKVFDHKKQQICCLKIIRNKKKFQNQALVELNILTFIKEKDEENLTNIVKIKDFVIFRNHVCIVCELLSMNLYELIKSNNYQGLSLELIRRFAIQILNSLNFLYKHRVVHCDLKPENILLKQQNKSGIKIIDFGSSCFEHERIYSYIQSRYYRAPEVIFGLPYDMGIDMWSFGCIMAELYIGYPIFPGENEQEQISYIMEMIGVPDQKLIDASPRKKHFFTPSSPYQPIPYTNKRGKLRVPASKDIRNVIRSNDENFLDFLLKCFVWDPKQRIKPLEALMHSWILDGLPTEIRSQHVKYLESEQITQKAFFKPQQQNQHHVSEPEMNEYPKRPPQLRTLSKEKDISQLCVDMTPQSKKISQSFHTSKNNTVHKQQFNQYFPGTAKNDGTRKQQYFH